MRSDAMQHGGVGADLLLVGDVPAHRTSGAAVPLVAAVELHRS
jgi:hypothetical protein